MSLQLKEARIQAGYSLDQIANELNIRKQYLAALEDEDYSILPGKVYIDGYKKIYAKYLGVTLALQQADSSNQCLLQSKIINNEKFKKYLVIISLIVLILVITLYRLILQSDIETGQISITDDNNFNNDLNYTNESNQ